MGEFFTCPTNEFWKDLFVAGAMADRARRLRQNFSVMDVTDWLL
jgi:hypothetical protein